MPFLTQFTFSRCLVALWALTISTAVFAQTTSRRPCALLLNRNVPSPKQYFPQEVVDDLSVEWYTEQLSAMRDPALLPRTDCSAQIYRVVWLRTFHRRIVVR